MRWKPATTASSWSDLGLWWLPGLRWAAVALVLIVVDEPETLLTLAIYLDAGGHAVVLAADADTALERLAALAVDVVVLDIMMTVRDGWTVLEALHGRLRPPPAIIVSGRAGPGDLERASRLGAVGSLVLPVSAEALNQAVAVALSGSRA